MNNALKWAFALALLLLIFMGIAYATADLNAVLLERAVEPASARPEAFEKLYEQIARGDLDNNQYAKIPANDPGRYSFVTYTVKLSGFCPLPAQWALLNLTPNPGDIAFVQGDPQDVPAFGARTLTATLLTENEAANTPHRFWAEYYVFGALKSVTVQQPA